MAIRVNIPPEASGQQTESTTTRDTSSITQSTEQAVIPLGQHPGEHIGKSSKEIARFVRDLNSVRALQQAVRRDYQADLSALGHDRQESIRSIQQTFSLSGSQDPCPDDRPVIKELIQRLNRPLWPDSSSTMAPASFVDLTKTLQKANNRRKELENLNDKKNFAKVAGVLDRASAHAYLNEIARLSQAYDRKVTSSMQKANALLIQPASQALFKFASETTKGSCSQLTKLMCVAEEHGDPQHLIDTIRSFKDPTIDKNDKRRLWTAMECIDVRVSELATSGHPRGEDAIVTLTVTKKAGLVDRLFGPGSVGETSTVNPTIDPVLGAQFSLDDIVSSLQARDAPIYYAVSRTSANPLEGGHAILLGKKRVNDKDEYVAYDPNFGRGVFGSPKSLRTFLDKHFGRGSKIFPGSVFYTGKTFGLHQLYPDALKLAVDEAGASYGNQADLSH
jgi:hypothetical protein